MGAVTEQRAAADAARMATTMIIACMGSSRDSPTVSPQRRSPYQNRPLRKLRTASCAARGAFDEGSSQQKGRDQCIWAWGDAQQATTAGAVPSTSAISMPISPSTTETANPSATTSGLRNLSSPVSPTNAPRVHFNLPCSTAPPLYRPPPSATRLAQLSQPRSPRTPPPLPLWHKRPWKPAGQRKKAAYKNAAENWHLEPKDRHSHLPSTNERIAKLPDTRALLDTSRAREYGAAPRPPSAPPAAPSKTAHMKPPPTSPPTPSSSVTASPRAGRHRKAPDVRASTGTVRAVQEHRQPPVLPSYADPKSPHYITAHSSTANREIIVPAELYERIMRYC